MTIRTTAAVLLAVAFAATAAWVLRGAADASHSITDGGTYRFQGKMLALGRAWVDVPAVDGAFHVPMTLQHEGKWFGQYYPGFPALLAIGELAGADWLVNPLLGGLLVLGTFLLGWALYDETTGLIAAGILCVSPYLLSQCTSYLSHPTCAVLLVFAALAAGGRMLGNAWASGVLAGLLFGWAVTTRPYTGLLAAPAIGLALLDRFRRERSWGVRAGGALAATAALFALGLFQWNRMLTGDPLLSPVEMRWPQVGLGFHEIPPHNRFLTGQTVDRYTPEIAGIAALRQLRNLDQWLLPIAGGGVALVILPLVFFRAMGWRGAALALFPLTLVAGYLLYPGTMGTSALGWGPRYYSEALPVYALLLARPLARVLQLERRVGIVLGALLVAALLAGGERTVSRVAEMRRAQHDDPLVGANRRLERFLDALPDERRLVFVDISTYNRFSALLVNRPDLQGRDLVAVYREPDDNRAVLDAYPGRSAWLVRWDDAAGDFRMDGYVPEEDEEGPPNRFPYNRKPTGRRKGLSGRKTK